MSKQATPTRAETRRDAILKLDFGKQFWVKAIDPTDPEAGEKVFVDPDRAFPRYLQLLGVETPDQFWLEIARLCFTRDLSLAQGEAPLHLVILKSEQWRLSNHKPGDGATAAARRFMGLYNKLAAKRRVTEG